MKPKIILHCGAPKTGSTSFQYLLYDNRQMMLDAGIFVPDVSRKKRAKNDIRILLGQLGKRKSRGKDKAKVAPRLKAQIRKIIDETAERHHCQTIFVSNESILGMPLAQQKIGTGAQSRRLRKRGERPTGYAGAARKIAAIAEVLKDYDVEVRIVIRDFSTFLPSLYVQMARMGETASFDQFRVRYGADRFSYLPMIQALRKAFGAQKVKVVNHADLVADNHAVLSDAFPAIMAALGGKGHRLPNKNSSIGSGMVKWYRRWNRLTASLPISQRWRREVRNFGRKYMLLPLERFSNSARIAYAPDDAKAQSARFQAEWAEINASQTAQ